MTTKNPFGQMKINYGDDDEENPNKAQTQTNASTTGQQLFNISAPDQKKKKKIRPEEKKKLEEVPLVKDEELEGFSEVKKKAHNKPKVVPLEEGESEVKKERHMKGKLPQEDPSKPKGVHKREFERHSGTGRGKEISKEGAGGKHTWGTNPKTVSRQEEDAGNEDDYYIHRALNPKPKKAEREEYVEENIEPIAQTAPVEEEPKVVEEAHKEEPAPEKYEEKRKGKKKPTEEVKKEDLLDVPENAISYAEYAQQLKAKNQALQQSKTVERPKDSELLNPQTKNDDMTIGLTSATSTQKKPKAKAKEKKTDKEGEDIISKKVISSLQIEGGDDHPRREYKDKRNQKKEEVFLYNAEEFPEL